MDIRYKSTRDDSKLVSASYAIIKGIAEDGGLFMPDQFPSLEISLEELSKLDYKGVAYEVMKLFFSDFTEEELRYCIENAYDSKFDTEEIVPMSFVDGAYYLELFHGSTIAFKDMALSILPYLMKTAARKNNINEKIVILTATSGDTGKAALAGFAGVEGVKIVVFYPKGGVSAIQEKQMVTQAGDNVKVVGITGNFDDAQTGVKNIFADKEFNEKINKAGYRFSSANSINIGRLIPQVAYYVYAYANLLKNGKIEEGDLINFVVPTGNFGNILAGYFAKRIGIPV
ncbi:MAG: threonine synthase, partial [Lachnospiraceae bacterium]|nr:threonine synthase [Lachnospiraceae bacterium]